MKTIKRANKIAQWTAELDEADALIFDLLGIKFGHEVAYPAGSNKTRAIENHMIRCIERAKTNELS